MSAPDYPIRTFVNIGKEEVEATNREGFSATCRYGIMKPEPNELGAIVRAVGVGHYSKGFFLRPVVVLERIFLRPQEDIGGA